MLKDGKPGGRPAETALRVRMILQEALAGFRTNGDLRQASSLAFYATLALVPAMLFLTYILGLVMGSSQAAHQKVTYYLVSMAPDQAERVLADVAALTRFPGTIGFLNLLVLAWSVTPLVSALREIVKGIFRERESRSVWIVKLLDLSAGMVALISLAAIAGAGAFLHLLNTTLQTSLQDLTGRPLSLGFILPFTVTTTLVAALLRLYGPRDQRLLHVAAGALTTASLWFLLRPAFTVFLTYNQNYGLAFGSFKSIFVIFIWIYVSMAILLLGAEVAAACHRGDAVAIKRLMENRWGPRFTGRRELLLDVPEGHTFFQEGEPGAEMFYLLTGSVGIRKGDGEVARIGPGSFFGEMAFLLGQDRSATAVALVPCTCVVVHGRNFHILLREFPETVRLMLVEMATRLRDTTERSHPPEHVLPALQGVEED